MSDACKADLRSGWHTLPPEAGFHVLVRYVPTINETDELLTMASVGQDLRVALRNGMKRG